jgi:hypothetical protein
MKQQPILAITLSLNVVILCLHACWNFGFWPKALTDSSYMPWFKFVFTWNPVLLWISILLNARNTFRRLSVSKEERVTTWMR